MTRTVTVPKRPCAALALALLAAAALTAPPVDGEADPVDLPAVLDLEAAKAIALRRSPTLKAAAARVDQARARMKQARAAFFPALSASWGMSETWLDENTHRALKQQATLGPFLAPQAPGATIEPLSMAYAAWAGRRGVSDHATTYTAALTAQWLVFNGLAREFDHAAARFGAKESDAALRETQRLILGAVASSYYAVALAREDRTIAEADEAFNLRLLDEARARRAAGAGSLSDVLNFEVRVNAARSARIRAERVYAVGWIGLRQLLGLPDGALSDSTQLAPLAQDPPAASEAPDADALVAYALAHRPDLRQRSLATERTRRTVAARRGAFYPTVSLSASKTAVSMDDSHLGEDDFATTVGVNVTQTLFAGGGNRARLSEAKAAHAEARYARTDTEIAVAAEVRQAVEHVAAARKELTLQLANAALVRKNRDLVEKEYRAGQASLVRLNEAQRDLIAAQARQALARVALRQAAHDLETATGQVLEPHSAAP